MIRARIRRLWPLAALLLAVASLSPAPASAAIEPVFVFRASQNLKPGGEFEGPCGLAVDLSGNFYVSDYYHHAVDVYNTNRAYITQIAKVDPAGGPCGLAVDGTGRVYVNNFHRNVVRYTPSSFPLGVNATYGTALTISSAQPTGVAVNLASGNVYVNERTTVGVYDSTGLPILDGGEPLRIGTFGDAYGLAYSGGRLYVPDAASNTVKIFEPESSTIVPVATISGPGKGFESLEDTAIAVDGASGVVYVADHAGSRLTERPESVIDVFNAGGAYLGHLKYNVIDAAPVGLAVDNSAGVNQGRVYVTSGNTSPGSVYAYTANAATMAPLSPASTGPAALAAATAGETVSAAADTPGVAAAIVAPPAASPGTSAGQQAAPVRRRATRHRKRAHRQNHRRAHRNHRAPGGKRR